METQETLVVEGRRLGKLPPKFDPRTFRAAHYINPRKLPHIPKVVDRMSRVTKGTKKVKGVPFPMLANNRLGDCGLASIEHADITAETWGLHPAIEEVDREARAIRNYSAISGYDPNTGANDNGVYLLDVLKYAQHKGLGGDGTDTIGPYLAVDPLDERQMVACLFLFGVLYTGVGLPVSAQKETGKGKTWSTVVGPGSEPWSWGGHAIYTGRITTKSRRCVTWGAEQEMSEEWQARYMDEAWTYIDPEFVRENTGKTVSGLDLAGLMADLEAMRNK